MGVPVEPPGHGTHTGKHLRHRPAPPPGSPALWQAWTRERSGGRLNLIVPMGAITPAGGATLVTASFQGLAARYGKAREAFPPAWSDTFAIHPAAGVPGSMA